MINNQPHYKIIFSTQKAHKMSIDGIEFWIVKKWINPDGSLSIEALKAYEEARALDEASRKKAKRISLASEEIDIEGFVEDAIGIGHESVNLTSIVFAWLKELTVLLSLLFEHEKMRDPSNKIYAIDVWRRIGKKLKSN